eukprot:2328482-Rhodomonas_salina.1
MSLNLPAAACCCATSHSLAAATASASCDASGPEMVLSSAEKMFTRSSRVLCLRLWKQCMCSLSSCSSASHPPSPTTCFHAADVSSAGTPGGRMPDVSPEHRDRTSGVGDDGGNETCRLEEESEAPLEALFHHCRKIGQVDASFLALMQLSQEVSKLAIHEPCHLGLTLHRWLELLQTQFSVAAANDIGCHTLTTPIGTAGRHRAKCTESWSLVHIDRSLSVALVEQWLVVFPCSPCTDTPETATWGTATCAASPSPPVPRSSHRSSVRPCFGTAEVHCSCRSATWACSCAISLRAASSARLSLPSPAETPASCPPTPQDPVEV